MIKVRRPEGVRVCIEVPVVLAGGRDVAGEVGLSSGDLTNASWEVEESLLNRLVFQPRVGPAHGQILKANLGPRGLLTYWVRELDLRHCGFHCGSVAAEATERWPFAEAWPNLRHRGRASSSVNMAPPSGIGRDIGWIVTRRLADFAHWRGPLESHGCALSGVYQSMVGIGQPAMAAAWRHVTQSESRLHVMMPSMPPPVTCWVSPFAVPGCELLTGAEGGRPTNAWACSSRLSPRKDGRMNEHNGGDAADATNRLTAVRQTIRICPCL